MAIAFDNATDGGFINPGSSLTYSHTVGTGSNRILFAMTDGSNGGSDVVTGVTYAGAAMTKIGAVQCPSDRWCGLWYLVNPASGANNVVILQSASTFIASHCSSYSGAKQSGVPDASTTNTGSSITSLTTSVTTVIENSWTILATVNNAFQVAAGAGTTQRESTAGPGLFDSNGPKTPAGSTSLIVTASSSNFGVVMASFAPSPNQITRSPSDSILNGASRSATVARIAGFTRTVSASILNSASRFASLSRVLGAIRSPSDSILNGASRSSTVSRFAVYTRAMSDSITNGASRFATLAKGFARSLSDSFMNASSRLATVVRIFGAVRSPSDSIINGASRTSTLSRLISFTRSLSDSVSNAASRFATVARIQGLIRALSDEIMAAEGRFATMKAFVNGLLIQFKSKYTTQGSSYSSKYTKQDTEYENKYQ